ncbi:hydantoinase/oxoprolinase N-terminal domain-containing protein [Nocardiopsis composta]|uniref:Putative NBD/HSP70 family sugar kinase n=1 Tax=Nocardiopsis composta TaxID=157465 RepID=A0A7W8VD17_9ACTN|nr:hydantoinase/oxoprolinase N-terminal domain-containing protein [Nocardiopsis composta]MBB5431787.1 putative NBD/HSP70 family sugar kinase [Nocardiopsis composta]
MGGAAGAGGTGAGRALGIDVGGTFTDVAVVRGDGRTAVAKVLSTHRDPVEAAVRVTRRGAERDYGVRFTAEGRLYREKGKTESTL